MSYFDNKDRGRATDPMTSVDRSPAYAPNWQLNRVVSAQDSGPYTDEKLGINCNDYEHVRFSVVPYDYDPTINSSAAPGGSANPNIEVRIWSEGAGQFLKFDTAITKTGLGAGIAYMVDVPNAYGAVLFVEVTNALGGIAAIYSQGYGLNHAL